MYVIFPNLIQYRPSISSLIVRSSRGTGSVFTISAAIWSMFSVGWKSPDTRNTLARQEPAGGQRLPYTADGGNCRFSRTETHKDLRQRHFAGLGGLAEGCGNKMGGQADKH